MKLLLFCIYYILYLLCSLVYMVSVNQHGSCLLAYN